MTRRKLRVEPQKPRVTAGTVIAFLIAAASVVWCFRYARGPWAGIDFYQFWAGSQLARRADAGSIYAPETQRAAAAEFLLRAQTSERSDRMLWSAQRRSAFEFFSTPFLYATFGIYGSRYERAFLAYQIVILLAFISSILILARLGRLSLTATFLLLAFLLTLFEPLRSELRVGNVNSLQLLAVTAAMWSARTATTRGSVIAGALIGLSLAFKPNVILVAPLIAAYRLMRRDYRRLGFESAGFAAGGLAAFLIGSIYFRSTSAWVEWLRAVRALAEQILPLSAGNVSPIVDFAVQYGRPFAYVTTVVLIAVVLFALWRSRAVLRDDTIIVAGSALLIYLLSATLAWMHYLILALPAGMELAGDRNRARALTAIAGVVLIGGKVWNPALSMRAEARLFWAGLIAIFAAAIWRMASPRPNTSR